MARGMKAPSTKHQAPEKHQIPSFKTAHGAWYLELSLVLAAWSFGWSSFATELRVVTISPPEKNFFSKQLDFHGIPIKAHAVVADEALYAAYGRLSLLLSNQPLVISNLAA